MSNPILRRFVRNAGKKVDFWNLYRLRAGSGYLISQGEDSSLGTSQPVLLSTNRTESARCTREMEERIQRKLAEGFTEITDAPWHGGFTSSLRTSLEEALSENPDDLSAHMAYADHLTDLGDPRGEFIQVQLALENESLSPSERGKLQQREMALLSKYQRNWLGPMAGFWLDKMDSAEGYHTRTAHQLTWRRGWIDSLGFHDGGSGVQAALQWSAMLRCLRELRIVSGNYSDDRYGYGDLSQADFFRNVRILQIGPDQSTQNYFGETTEAADYYDRMPFLEELHIYNGIHNFEDSFPHLRRLTIYHYSSEYPMAVLANNASLRSLTHLALWPRGMSNDAPGEIGLNEDGGYARISRTGAITLFRSPHCSHIEHLVLRNSDLGDEGLRVMIETGWLRRLKTLDLLGGCVTDVGARLLADNPTYGQLELLNLSHNMLTATGIAVLRRAGLALVAEHQHGPEAFQMYEYLYEGDCE